MAFKDIYDALQEPKDKIDYIVQNKKLYYVDYSIAKKGSKKKRRISAPQGDLKLLQEKILYTILYRFRPSNIAHGFVKGKSVVTNARIHLGAKVLVKLDIHQFFPSIKRSRVVSTLDFLFKATSLFPDATRNEALEIISQLITVNDCLPQGASTSPAMSNLVCYSIDKQLWKLSKDYNAKVTRYSDDITISSIYNRNIAKMIPIVYRILVGNGFKPNKAKTHLVRQNASMRVTGIVVNQKLNAPRTLKRNLRAELHNLEVNKTVISEDKQNELQGKIAWIKSLNPPSGNLLTASLLKVKSNKFATSPSPSVKSL